MAVSGYKPTEIPTGWLEMSACGYEVVNGWGWGVWQPWPPYWSWTPLYTVIPFTHPAWQKPEMKAMVQFKDVAGNVTQVQTSIQLKPPPLGHLLPLLLN